jgi:S1-C subfamily serine protease
MRGDDADYEGTLGLAALKRLDVIIDGKEGVAYLRPKTNSPPAYDHNRLAAVFTPPDMKADGLIAHVLDGGPAYEAGIRSGDILLKGGELDVTKWRTDPAVMPLSQFWMRAPGSKLELTLKRGNDTFKKTVVLRQILSPETDAKAQPGKD